MNILERYFAPHKGALREFAGISAFLEPADPSLYRRLLPQPFAMPEQPLVGVVAIDYVKAAPWPLTRWQEWGVLLRCAWRGNVGWHPVTMPVTGWWPMSAGRYLGYPKYVADTISLTRHGGCWKAQGVHRGVRQLGMAFEPGVTRQPQPWEAKVWSNPAPFKGDVYLLVPPGTGAAAQRVSFAYVEEHWTSQRGTVRLESDVHESWAGLVPCAGSFPGAFSRFVGGVNLVVERLTP